MLLEADGYPAISLHSIVLRRAYFAQHIPFALNTPIVKTFERNAVRQRRFRRTLDRGSPSSITRVGQPFRLWLQSRVEESRAHRHFELVEKSP
jgi:hypothetical protein